MQQGNRRAPPILEVFPMKHGHGKHFRERPDNRERCPEKPCANSTHERGDAHHAQKKERHRIRREQILVAARHCVIRGGFHATTMDEIAREAELSVGQIYRYFENKNAIIEAIINAMLERRTNWVRATLGRETLARTLTKSLLEPPESSDPDWLLHLEATAEASRNPDVRKLLQAADRSLQNAARETMRLDYPEMSDNDINARIELLATLFEGSAFRDTVRTSLLNDVYVATLTALLADLFPASKRES